jgi:hypothetical protein
VVDAISTDLERQLCKGTVDTDVVNFIDLARSIQLFVIRKQVMAGKIAFENFYNVLSVGDAYLTTHYT